MSSAWARHLMFCAPLLALTNNWSCLAVPTTGVRSITGPWYRGTCPHPSCSNPQNCPGNRLSYAEGKQGVLHLHLQHLKTSRWASFVPVSFDLPARLNTLFTALIGVVRDVLMTTFEDHAYIFFTAQTGKPLKPQEVSQNFRSAFPESLQAKIPSPRECRCVGILCEPTCMSNDISCWAPTYIECMLSHLNWYLQRGFEISTMVSWVVCFIF